jgi:putative ABC transport system permease protein
MTVSERAPLSPPAARRQVTRSRGMSLWEAVMVALHGLVANKMRSFLTMLGIIIGVASVILTIGLGQGAASASQAIIASMGTNVLSVRPDSQRTGAISQGLGSSQTLTVEDSDAILKECPSVKAVAPEYSGRQRAKYMNRNTSTTVLGTTPEHLDVRNLKLAAGRFFTHSDVARRAKVAVIGDEVKLDLFGENVEPVGKFIKIKSQNFEVVGVMAYKGSMGWSNPDDQIWVPLDTAMKRLYGVDYIGGIGVQAQNDEVMNDAKEEIERLISKRHRIPFGDPPDVRIFNQADLAETAQQQSDMMTMLLTGIALVSLLVGGIGIMNIMLVSVTERTREIGIRKAIGARWRDIMNQFLIESVTMSLVGGLIGVGLGVGGAWLMSTYVGWTTLITPKPILMAFASAMVVGVFFGIYPAMKAARLNPIEALRYE